MYFLIFWIVVWAALIAISIYFMHHLNRLHVSNICLAVLYWLLWPVTSVITLLSVYQVPAAMRYAQQMKVLTMQKIKTNALSYL